MQLDILIASLAVKWLGFWSKAFGLQKNYPKNSSISSVQIQTEKALCFIKMNKLEMDKQTLKRPMRNIQEIDPRLAKESLVKRLMQGGIQHSKWNDKNWLSG